MTDENADQEHYDGQREQHSRDDAERFRQRQLPHQPVQQVEDQPNNDNSYK